MRGDVDKTKGVKPKPAKSPSLRITGGEWRSRVLQAPNDQSITRPTMDQTRQAVFNILSSADWALHDNGQPLLLNGTVLDGFAGSGAYAFEALSRSAAFATMIDKNNHAMAACAKNAELLKCADKTKVIRSDLLAVPVNAQAPVTLCFLDPPYDVTDWSAILEALRTKQWIDQNTLLILEGNSKMTREFNEAVDGLINVHDQRRYGHALVTFGRLI